jgi:ATP-binding cassette subfamily B protein
MSDISAQETQKIALTPLPQKKKNALATGIRKQFRSKRVRPVLQMAKTECGLASLAMILNYYGHRTLLSDLRLQFGVSRDGASVLGIVKAARACGLRVKTFSLQHNDFSRIPLPAIAHWEFNHFVVVERWSHKHVDIVDPAYGKRRLSYEDFDLSFTGIIVTLEPGAQFRRRAKSSAVSLRTYIKQTIKQSPHAMLQILMASIFLQSMGLISPILSKVIMDQILPGKMTNAMTILALGMVILLLSQGVITLLREWVLVYLRARLDMQMMTDFLKHLLSLPYSYFQQRSSGDLLTRVNSNNVIRDVLSNQLIATLLDSGLVTAYLLILLWQSPPFAIVTIVIGLLQMIVTLTTYRPIMNLTNRELAAQGKSQGYVAEALNGIASIKAAGAENRALEHWTSLFFDQLNISIRRGYLTAAISTIMSLLGMFAPLALLWVGAIQVLNGHLSIGSMLALIALAGSFLSPLSSMVGRIQQLQTVHAHLDRLADVTAAKPEQDQQLVQVPPRLSGNVQLENVNFQYDPNSPKVLHDIKLTVNAGQKIAIVGRTGSGKSTLGKLLLGLYIPTSGSIYYDGIPLQHMQYQAVRRQFGVVMQDAMIFSGTMHYNIALNNPDMSKEQVMQAAQIAGIHEDIMRMPMGYDTFVGESGSALSGGQRQRLAIARAVANNPSILLLDEATSSLDVLTEQHVSQHLQQMACTQIIIAHRLSTIRNADVILVLDQGHIVELGAHDELVEQNGYYAKLVQQQLMDDEKDPIDMGTIPPSNNNSWKPPLYRLKIRQLG